ncbi:PQQ-like beta-propeller repeat protein [candidate division KSB1 bacterium]|nr:PQQ-like beta-propeller repeat protein [candidate division KSB1 bacterium]
MNSKKENKTEFARTWYRVARAVAVVAVAFNLIVSILIIANFFQTKMYDPIKSPVLEKLIQKANENPSEISLKEEIRALDLLARKAYFTKKWQIRTGGFILFGGVLVLLIAFKYMNIFRRYLPELDGEGRTDDSWEKKFFARKYLVGGYLTVLLISLILIIVSHNELSDRSLYFSEHSKTSDSGDGNFPSQEEINKNWPNFRGPGGNGIAFATNAPTEWDDKTGKNIIWKTEIPLHGFNSPIYWEGKIFLSGADKIKFEVYCFDANSGRILWQKEVKDVPGSPEKLPNVTEDTGYAAPTMATDGKRVFALFANGDLVCLDFEGNQVWAKNLGVPDNHYGHSTSLIMYENLLIIQYDHFSGRSVMGLNAMTGKVEWQTPRQVEISWASPILVDTGKRMELILNASPLVASYDPKTGKELWQFKCMSGEVGPSVCYANGIVYAANEYARLAAIKIGKQPEMIWEYDDGLPEASSPVATEKYLFMATSWGVISCLDAKNGSFYWEHEFKEGFYSSLILVGDNIYLVDRKGFTHVFKAAKEFELVSTNDLGESSDCIPAIVNGRIYMRGEKHLFCIGE